METADVVCLQETWLSQGKAYKFDLVGLKTHFNSIGLGKGIATFFCDRYKLNIDVTTDKYQMTKISSDSQDIINVYRSAGASSSQFVADLKKLFDAAKKTLLVGDLNICFKEERNHFALKAIENLGFKQKVARPTHSGGRHIDHVFIFAPVLVGDFEVEVIQQSPYFTDYDLLFIIEATANPENLEEEGSHDEQEIEVLTQDEDFIVEDSDEGSNDIVMDLD